jgi:hypothetical protein
MQNQLEARFPPLNHITTYIKEQIVSELTGTQNIQLMTFVATPEFDFAKRGFSFSGPGSVAVEQRCDIP